MALPSLQITAAAEPSLLEAWRQDAGEIESDSEDEAENDFVLTAAIFKAKCSCWWTPREPLLGKMPQPATFEVEVS